MNAHSSEECAGPKQPVEDSGAPPVEPLSLLYGSKHESQSGTEVQESDEARRRTAFWSRRSRRYSLVDTDHHHRHNDGGAPEHPMPGKMVSIPSIE